VVDEAFAGGGKRAGETGDKLGECGNGGFVFGNIEFGNSV
jgi:hypothetical protein